MVERGYNRALASSKQRMQRELRLGEWLSRHQKIINDIFKRGQVTTDDDPNSSVFIDATPSYGGEAPHTVGILISVRQLEGLKDPRLEKIITPFLDAPVSRCSDYPQALNRDYHFEYAPEGGTITVTVAAYVKEENPTCRKILVERKAVTSLQEIYKLSCDGDIVDADPVLPKLEG